MADSSLGIDQRGNILRFDDCDEGEIVVSHKELEQIANRSAALAKLPKLPNGPEVVEGGYDINYVEHDNTDTDFSGNRGDVYFGCQQVTAAQVQQVLKLSQKARRR